MNRRWCIFTPVPALTEYRAFVSALRLNKKRQRAKKDPWTLLVGVFCLLTGLVLSGFVAELFELRDDGLRRNVLNLLAGLGFGAWVIAGALLRLSVTPIFDYSQLLSLPVGFRILFVLRVVVGLSGLWTLICGPTLLYLLLYRTAGLLGFTVALLASVALVVLLGRLVAISILKLEDVPVGWPATAVLLLVAVAGLFALEPTIQNLMFHSREVRVSVIATQVRDAGVLNAMAYLPGGLLTGIFDAPRGLGGNLARLASLFLLASAALALEYRLLRRRLLESLPAKATTGGVHFPLTPVLRRICRLAPESCLRLIEFEILMRKRWYRGMMTSMVFLLPVVQTGSVYIVLGTTVVLSASFLAPRLHSYGVAHRNLAERFVMPVPLLAPATAYGTASSVLPAFALLVVICWAWYRGGWPGLGVLGLWLVLPFCDLVGGHGASVFQSARSPIPFDFGPYAGKTPADLPVWPSVAFNAAIISLPALLAFLVPRTPWGPAAAICGTVVLMISSVVFNAHMLRSADRLVRSDPHRILERLTGSGN